MKKHIITGLITLFIMPITFLAVWGGIILIDWITNNRQVMLITFIVFMIIVLVVYVYMMIYKLLGSWLDDHYNKD